MSYTFKILNCYLFLLVTVNNICYTLGDIESVNFKLVDALLRSRRQAGYVYDRPSVAFDLPTRQVGSTQAPTSAPTQSQQMYYAYPVPGGNIGGGSVDGVVNIGFPTMGSATSSTLPSTPGSTPSPTGYNYGSSTSNAGTSGSYASGITGNTLQSSTSSGITGYNYGGPSSTTGSPSSQPTDGPTFSTNAPTYLPPTAGPGSNQMPGSGPGTSVNINLPGNLLPSNAAASYLPPLSSSAAQFPNITPGSTISTPGTSPSPGYLPPQSGTSPTSPTPFVPPITSPSTPRPGTVSTPAPTYLPPLL